ncbi:MAG: anthranilate synthase component I family protein [Phycisphaerales bacterium]|nr:anthranilate synthase component I family protein [Phycisphaerales bacterium]
MTRIAGERSGIGGVLGGMSVGEVMMRWPEDVGAAWLTGSGEGERGRWTILGIPTGGVEREDPMRVLDGVGCRGSLGGAGDGVFDGGWIGWVGYEVGERIEATVRAGGGGPLDDRGWGACRLVRCDAALVHDGLTGAWRCAGDAALCGAVIERVMRGGAHAGRFGVGRMRSVTGRARYERDVARVIGLIHAGDAFQVNLAHRLSGRFEGSARGAFVHLMERVRPWYGALIEDVRADGTLAGCVCSASPELFLRVDGRSGRVETRPMKGTRGAGCDPEELRRSEKDRAELAMIVDLMRNDLGRVCGYGSVRVEQAQAVEAHHGARGGVWQGVATVSGVVREGVSHGELMRAAFPPGSVTGAPKVRAMQLIREMEPVTRGAYCGAIGFVSDGGDAAWSVGIRTAQMRFDAGSTVADARGTIDYSVGAGIVADSEPGKEWRETLTKAAAFRAAMREGSGR